MRKPKLYRVRFRRPDGSEAWLGEAGCGPAEDPSEAPAVPLDEAKALAESRNQMYGPERYYWPEEAKTP